MLYIIKGNAISVHPQEKDLHLSLLILVNFGSSAIYLSQKPLS